jgi:hypothetical protein
VTKQLFSSLTDAEQTSTVKVTAFNSDGYSIGPDTSGIGDINFSATGSYVDWLWKAGGAAVTNTAGSISSQVSANVSAGFSVVTYTGTGANATVGHGLGAPAKMVIVKQRNASAANWTVYHSNLTSATYAIFLNLTAAQDPAAGYWNSTAPTSSVFSLGTSVAGNGSGTTYVAYCFAEVAGYSKFGSYTGNGSADGPFVYLGFRPRWIMVKNASAATDWTILDSSRDTGNMAIKYLIPNTSGAETSGSSVQLDILSNGFKIRGTWSGMNGNTNTIIYAAFSENPFKNSLAR